MRFPLLVLNFALLLGGCASTSFLPGERFAGKTYDSKAELSTAIMQQCSAETLKLFCTDRRKIKKTTEYSQSLITWGESNWRGEFEVEGPDSFRVRWIAIVIGKKVEACEVTARKDDGSWLLRYEMAPDLPWQPWEVRKLIDAAEKKEPKKSPDPTS